MTLDATYRGDVVSARPFEPGVFVVIPAFNEGSAIADTVRAVRNLWDRVMVVDDGSCDETSAIARKAGAIVVRHPINLGQGAAIRTGVDFALELGAAYVVTFDADGQHEAADIGKLIEALRETGFDVAFGSRFLGEVKGLPAVRRLFLKAAVLVTYLTTGLRMTDAHNGLRAFTRHAAQRIRIRQERMAHGSEIVSQVARHKLSFVEVPVTVKYTEYSLRKGQKLRDSIHIIIDLISGKLHR